MGDFNWGVNKSSRDYNTRRLQFLSTLYLLDPIINSLMKSYNNVSFFNRSIFFTKKRENMSKSDVNQLCLFDHSMISAVKKVIVPKSDLKININDFFSVMYVSQISWETATINDNQNVCWKICKYFLIDTHPLDMCG
jgi:hypothetical protein